MTRKTFIVDVEGAIGEVIRMKSIVKDVLLGKQYTMLEELPQIDEGELTLTCAFSKHIRFLVKDVSYVESMDISRKIGMALGMCGMPPNNVKVGFDNE